MPWWVTAILVVLDVLLLYIYMWALRQIYRKHGKQMFLAYTALFGCGWSVIAVYIGYMGVFIRNDAEFASTATFIIGIIGFFVYGYLSRKHKQGANRRRIKHGEVPL